MLDVGRQQAPLPSLNDLKRNLSDPIGYFLGKRFESVVYPDQEGEYYGFPPGKDYVFAGVDQFQLTSRGFTPLSSFARGGLAEAWTAGVYPLNEAELEHYPVSLDEMTPYYDLVAQRIGITGETDDLSRFMPVHDHLMTPLDLDEHSQTLLRSYVRKKHRLNERYRCFVGRSRLATLSADANGRKSYGYLGRCLWGCPRESLYTPVVTLRHCMQFPTFQYLPGQYVTHFELDRARRVTAVVAETLDDRTTRRFDVDRLVLAAGTLSSCKIILDSVFRHSGECVVLRGLMDNRQILMPFLNLHMVGQQFNPDSYQYQQLALGTSATDYVHGQITTLTTALIHPLVQQLPLDFRSALSVFRNVHAALGLINAMFCDTRRDDNCVTLGGDPSHARSTLVVKYSPPRVSSDGLPRLPGRCAAFFGNLAASCPPACLTCVPWGPVFTTPG